MATTDLKENLLAHKMEGAIKWGVENRSRVLIFVGAGVAALLISSVFIIRNKEVRDQSWTRLSQAQALMNQHQYDAARQVLTEVQTLTQGTSTALYATYYLGELNLDQKRFDEAAQNFSEVAGKAGKLPLRPLALSNLGFAQEQKPDYSAAITTYQQFMSEFNEHFLAPRVQLALGRAQILAGDKEAAKKTLNQLVDLYPTSPWAENARRLMEKV